MQATMEKKSKAANQNFRISPANAGLGAVVEDLDLRSLSDADFGRVRAAWHHHLVLVFKHQTLDDDDLIAFANRFGDMDDEALQGQKAKPQKLDGRTLPPEIVMLSNKTSGGEVIGKLGNSEVVWHSDYSYREVPTAGRLLYGVQCPPVHAGGSTSFQNSYAAFDELPNEMKRRLSGMKVKQDDAFGVTMELKPGADLSKSVVEAAGPSHPFISTHPETGRNALFLGRRSRSYVHGLDLQASDAFLDELWAHATQERFCYTHDWSEGDLVLWDNRCTMHKRTPFDNAYDRVLLALQMVGNRPYEAPNALGLPRHERFAAQG